jgi:hypothetical protein
MPIHRQLDPPVDDEPKRWSASPSRITRVFESIRRQREIRRNSQISTSSNSVKKGILRRIE